MDTENAALITKEFARLRAEIERTGFGTVGVAFVIHDGQVSRIVRTTEESARPSGPRRIFNAGRESA
jgi:hypothetical protein